MATVQVRYIVHDVNAAISFYCKHLGFQEVIHPAPAFAMLSRGDLRLVLSAPNPSPPSNKESSARLQVAKSTHQVWCKRDLPKRRAICES